MNPATPHFLRVGTRSSKLALLQTQLTVQQLAAEFPQLEFQTIKMVTPGDRDKQADLRQSPADFFTLDLDNALLAGEIDLAVHSAKDLPPTISEGIDWFWLPGSEDPRDVWVLPHNRAFAELPSEPRIGVSSQRRIDYAQATFPRAQLVAIRGTMEERLAQLDNHHFDLLLMAGAALIRLGLQERISQWIPLKDLPVPPGQGRIAITFRTNDPLMLRLRAFFVKALRFVGAGTGSADYCTWGGIKLLQQAEVCIYDHLMDNKLLAHLPPAAEQIYAGKRCGKHLMSQSEINTLLTTYQRQGKRVVRLKGGDPGIFGRLAEEVEALETLSLPYQVSAGVSALAVATTSTGMLLTRRGVSRGFSVMTPRSELGGTNDIAWHERQKMPLVLFMSITIAPECATQLLAEGWQADTPVAIVFDAGSSDEIICRTTLTELANNSCQLPETTAPGIIIVGSAVTGKFCQKHGALRGKRVLLTCSQTLQAETALYVSDLGGIPLSYPVIQLTPDQSVRERLRDITGYSWVALTSPSAIRIFMQIITELELDLRKLPKIMSCGTGCAATWHSYGIRPELIPTTDFGSDGLIKVIHARSFTNERILRLRSEKAGTRLTNTLTAQGALVDDWVLYHNTSVCEEPLPNFDAAYFASASAVEAFVDKWGKAALQDKIITVIGQPTAKALINAGITPNITATPATTAGAISALARFTTFTSIV